MRIAPNIGFMLLAEQLVGEARERRARRMEARERLVTATSASAYLGVALAIALFLPSERAFQPELVIGLIIASAWISQVRFEFGSSYVVPEQLAYIPMLLLAPLPLVPLMVAVSGVLAALPELVRGTWDRGRWLGCVSDSWSFAAPPLVLAALAPGAPQLELAGVYALALAAQVLTDLAWALLRNALLDRLPTGEIALSVAGTARVDAGLTPIAAAAAIAAEPAPIALLALAPLVWLFAHFSKDREERYSKAIELQRAYRGTVLMLADVVEYDDPYTAHHSRALVDLVDGVADELGLERERRQSLEFAALLHDVGKIAIPKSILEKPASLTAEEYEVMKTHTIEGQFMLDRVGGVLGEIGEIVRSCHERWDGQGYPDGLAGEEIPIEARIVFACDAWNAMTTDRVYRKALSQAEALQELATNAGTQFDPDIAAAVAKVVEENKPALATVRELRGVTAATDLARSLRASVAG